MAILTNLNVIPMGSRHNMKQNILMIPAQAAADKPGLLCLQDVDDNGVVGEHYVWFDSTGVMRYHTSIPTNQDSDGSTVTSGANTALSNLAAVAINTALVSDTKNTDDLGSAALYWKDLYVGGDIYCQEAGAGTFDVKLAFTAPTADYTYTFPDAAANADVMLNTGAANTIAYAKGTSSIAFGANADLDIAAGITVNVDNATTIQGDLTVSATCVLDQDLQQSATPTFGATTLGTGSTVGNLTLANGSITDSSGAISFGNENVTTTGTINLGADNTNITVGASGSTDSRIYFDGAGNLMFYDTNLATARSLSDLYSGTTLNPNVSGDLTISDGFLQADETADTASYFKRNNATGTNPVLEIEETHATGGVALLVDSNATDSNDAMQITHDGTGKGLSIIGTAVTSSQLSMSGPAAQTTSMAIFDGTTGAGWDGASGVGMVNLSGDGAFANAAASLLNITDGTGAMIAAARGSCLRIIDTTTNGADSWVAYIDSTNNDGLLINTGAVADINLKLTGLAAQTGQMFYVDGSTGAGWDGAANVGMVHLVGDGAHADAAASLLYITDTTGAQIASARGSCLRIIDSTTAGADGWIAYMSTTNNDGLLIDTGAATDINLKLSSSAAGTNYMAHIDGTTGTWVGASNVGALTVDSDGVLAAGASLLRVSHATGAPTAQSHLLEIEGTGTWAGSTDGTCLRVIDSGAVAGTSSALYVDSTANNGIEIQTAAAAASNLILTGSSGQTSSMMVVDGTPTNGFVGASGVGMLHLQGDGTLADVAASTLLINYTGTTASGANGSNLRIVDGGTSGGGTSYSVYIDAGTNMEAIKVDSGTVVVDETVEATGGIITVNAITDVADPPTQANMDTAFGAGAAALDGMIGIINDANLGTNAWLCVCTHGQWYYAAKLTVGA